MPDRLLTKLVTACIASRNFETAGAFVDLLMERDPGCQPYLDLYYFLESELEDADSLLRSATKLQRWCVACVRASVRARHACVRVLNVSLRPRACVRACVYVQSLATLLLVLLLLLLLLTTTTTTTTTTLLLQLLLVPPLLMTR